MYLDVIFWSKKPTLFKLNSSHNTTYERKRVMVMMMSSSLCKS